jgi:hypothetical protein
MQLLFVFLSRGLCEVSAAEPFHPEVEFLDVNLTDDSSILLHVIHSPFGSIGGFYRKTCSTLVLKIINYSTKQENSSLFMNSIL